VTSCYVSVMSYVRCANLYYYELHSRLGITRDGSHVLDQLDACLISREKRTSEKKLWSYTLHLADVVKIIINAKEISQKIKDRKNKK
jgi:hypothetical protein